MADEPVPQTVDPEAAPPPPVDASAVPAETVETVPLKTTSGSSTSVTPAPGELAALSDEQKAVQGAATAQAAVAPAQAELMERQAEGAMSQSDQFQADIAEREAKEAEHEKQIQAARALAAKAEDDVAGHHFHDLFEGEGTGHHILRIAAAALGGFGAGLVGGPNQAVEIMNRQVDRDFDRQKAELATKEKIAEWRRQGVTDLIGEQQRAIAALEVKQAKTHDAIAQQSIAIQTRAGVPVEAAKNNVLVQQQLAQAAGLRAQALQRFEKHHGYTSTTHEVQVKTPVVASDTAVATLSRAKDAGADRPALIQIATAMKVPKPLDVVDKLLKEPGGAGGSLANVRANQVYGDVAEARAALAESKPGVVTPKAINTIATNELRAKGGDKDVEEGGIGGLTTRMARGAGLSPRSKLDGLPPAVQKQYSLAEKMVMHLAEIQPSKGVEIQRQIHDRYFPYLPGLDKDEIARREKALGEAIISQQAIQDGKNKGGAGLAAARSIAEAKTPEERQRAIEALAGSTSPPPRTAPAVAPRTAPPAPAPVNPRDLGAAKAALARLRGQ